MRLAISICNDQIAPSLGRTEEFYLVTETGDTRLSCTGKIPLFLKQNQVELLICCGIGNCMMDLLNSMGIKVIPGVSGNPLEIKKKYFAGELIPGKKYSCADYGETCGACSGTF